MSGVKSSTISSKGQITVPVEVRRRLGVGPGDQVQFVTENGQTLLVPHRTAENPFLKYVGVAPLPPEYGGAVAWVRSLRDDEYEAEETRKRLQAAKKSKPIAA